jgi:hypothetical protein
VNGTIAPAVTILTIKMTSVHGSPSGKRAEMKVLLLGASGTEPSFSAWRTALEREGVPYLAIALRDRNSICVPGRNARRGLALVDGLGQACFQAVIVATGELLDEALRSSERAALEQLEREFGIRRLIAYTYPGPAHGLRAPASAGPLDEVQANLTPDGANVFPYLRGAIPIDPGSWAYLAIPLTAERFQTLVAGPGGSALIGIHRHADGREEMVQTFAVNAGQTQSQLLRHGQLAWVTRGTYLGHQRNYLPLHVDDVLLPNHAWDVATHAIDRDPAALIRMTADDAARAACWSRTRGLRLDLVCNGGGSGRYATEAGVDRDPLLDALVRERDCFGWVNHTYGHLNLDDAPQAAIEAEIKRNSNWARQLGIELEPGALVTGEHSGLANLAATPPRGENPKLAAALAAQAIRFIACDASRSYPVRPNDPAGPRWPPGTPFAVGTALAVPRVPTGIPYDAATSEQVRDQMRSDTSDGAPRSYQQLLAAEARRIFARMLSNDPSPHYFHQSNLARGDGGGDDGGEAPFYALVDAVVDRYRALLAPEASIVQPTFVEVGELLLQWAGWRAELAAGTISAQTDGLRVTISNRTSAPVEVPLTGTDVGSQYGRMRSGWLRAAPGETVVSIEPTERG